QFGTVEAIFERLDEVTPEKLRENLRVHEGEARMSKDLATIHLDAPIELDLEACRIRNFDRERVETLFHELEFRSLIGRLPASLGDEHRIEAKKTAAAAARHYRTITTPDEPGELGHPSRTA